MLAMQKNGIELTLDCNPEVIDPARSVFVKLTLKYPHDMTVTPPDLRDRVRGFSVAEDFEEAPVADKAGYITQIANWRLVPEPVAEEYKIAPFAVTASPRSCLRAMMKANSRSTRNPFISNSRLRARMWTERWRCRRKKTFRR